jgi:hypothetical protein
MRSLLQSSIALSVLFTLCIVGSMQLSLAQVATSTNYTLQSDSINFGGGFATSTNYQQENTFGELGTGQSSSTNYMLRAGYQQMQEVYLSLTAPTDVTMSPDIGGITGGTSNGSTTVTVTTDSPAGYELMLEAENSPAMQSVASSIPNHVTFTAKNFNSAGGSRFGYSVFGNDVSDTFKNDGALCGGGVNVIQECWRGLTTSPFRLASASGSNHPDGSVATLYFRVGVGAGAGVISGLYTATTTLTALPL